MHVNVYDIMLRSVTYLLYDVNVVNYKWCSMYNNET